jgi:carboxymethylenebutenolidase
MTALARRTLVTSIAGLPLAAILADPRLAALAADTLETVSVTTPGGLIPATRTACSISRP